MIKKTEYMRVCLTGVFTLLYFLSFCQKGDFLLTQHALRHSTIDHSNFGITHDAYGRLCIANRAGILKYDGEVWDFYESPSAALSLVTDSTGVVYTGCIGEVGLINFEGRQVKYRSLFKQDTLQDLFLETLKVENTIFFLGEKVLVSYDIATQELKTYEGSFLNMYALDHTLFVNTIEDATLALLDDSLHTTQMEVKIAYSTSKKNSPELALGFDNQLYEFNGETFDLLPQNDIIEQLDMEVQEIQWINDSLFVCSTYKRGLVFFNRLKPDYYDITDHQSGLPDNHIYTLHADNSNNVWVAHQFGITQIAPLFPAHSYSHYQGLQGKLTGVYVQDERLWVTTSLGLFYFRKDTLFENKVYYELKSKNTPQNRLVDAPQEKKAKKPFIKRLFGKKKRAQEEDSKGLFASIAEFFESEKIERIKGKIGIGKRYIRKIKRVPVSYQYAFDKIAGANGKFIDLLPYKNKLLGISTAGVYEISNDKAELIIRENIQSFLVNAKNQLILGTSDLQIKVFDLIEDVWVEVCEEPIYDLIVNMRDDENGTIWMAGTTSIYKTQTTDSSFQISDMLSLDNRHLDDVSIMRRNGTLYFINGEGYYYYNEADNQILEDRALMDKIGLPWSHLSDPTTEGTWIFNGKVWYYLSADGRMKAVDYLSIFPNLQAISRDPRSNHLWLINQSNELLKYDPAKRQGLDELGFFLREVSSKFGVIDQSEKFTLSYDENFLNIELSKPDFLGLSKPEFQYKLQGLNTDWSEWTQSKSVDYSFLPEGKYKLSVRVKDAFGRIEEAEVLSFSVKPPYWQTTWFYAIQVIFFGGLVYLSTKLNQDSSKNRLLSSGLTLLTLVLVIEFLQSAIGSLFSFQSTPVVDFLLDAVIAFMIFPLERILRELMTKGKVEVNIDVEKLPLVSKSEKQS